MSKVTKSTSPLDRKLRELAEEEERVRKELKSLEKAIKKGDVPLAPLPPRSPAPGQAVKPAGTSVADPGTEVNPAFDGKPFAWDDSADNTAAGVAVPSKPAGDKTKSKVYQDERFASYFTTGGFKSTVPLRHDAKVQRNKAVFMVVLVLLLGYILYAMLK